MHETDVVILKYPLRKKAKGRLLIPSQRIEGFFADISAAEAVLAARGARREGAVWHLGLNQWRDRDCFARVLSLPDGHAVIYHYQKLRNHIDTVEMLEHLGVVGRFRSREVAEKHLMGSAVRRERGWVMNGTPAIGVETVTEVFSVTPVGSQPLELR